MPMVTIACPRDASIKRVAQDLLKLLLVGNHVVGRQHRHDAGRRTRAHQRRAERDGGAGVAADRLGDEIGFGNFRKLLADFRQLRLVGDDENVFRRHQRQHAVDGLLEKRLFAEQRRAIAWASVSRLTGQKRSPRPPAMMMTNRSLVSDFAFIILRPRISQMKHDFHLIKSVLIRVHLWSKLLFTASPAISRICLRV